MSKGAAKLVSEAIYGKSAIAGHKKQEESCSYHEYIKASVKIPLHRGKINENDPEDIVANDRELIAIPGNNKNSNNSPEAQEEGNHRKFHIHVGDWIKN